MQRFEYRRRIDGDAWVSCEERKARDLLSYASFDLDELVDRMNEGLTARTQTHEVRVKPKLLLVNQNTPKPEPNGDILWA